MLTIFRHVRVQFNELGQCMKFQVIPVNSVGDIIISMYLAGKQCFLRNLTGSPILEYPALFTSMQNKMASLFVKVTEEDLLFKQVKSPCHTIPKKKRNWQYCIQRYVFILLFSDKCTQDEFKMFCLQMMSGRQAD